MKVSSLLVVLCGLLVPCLLPAADVASLRYEATGYLDPNGGIARDAGITISFGPKVPDAVRALEDNLRREAEKQGLKVVPRASATYDLVVTGSVCPAVGKAEAFYHLGLAASVFRIGVDGATQRERSLWEGGAGGWRGAMFDWAKKLPPPYVEPGKVIELLVGAIGREIAEPAGRAAMVGAGDTPGILQGSAATVINPPAPSLKAPPKMDDFNTLARSFFQVESFDFAKVPFEHSFVARFHGRTANDLYRELKLREKEFGGSVLITPQASGNEFIISVALRMVEQRGSKRAIYTRYLQIRYSIANMLRGVERGLYTKQVL
jgi:hypothetical protein